MARLITHSFGTAAELTAFFAQLEADNPNLDPTDPAGGYLEIDIRPEGVGMRRARAWIVYEDGNG